MNLYVTRRELVTGLGALALAPALPGGSAGSLRNLLDRIAAAGEPEAMLALIRRAPGTDLDRAEREILRMVSRGLERDVELRRAFPFGKPDGSSPYVLSQRHGAYLQIGAAGVPPADSALRLDEETERLRSEAALGLVPPDFVLDSVLQAQRALRAGAGRELKAALDRQGEAIERLRPVAGSAPGIWRLPGGEDYYRSRLRCTSGLDNGPERIGRLVAGETSSLLRRAHRLLKGLGLGQGSVGARLRALKVRPEHLFSDDGPGRARAVAGMNSALARVRPRLDDWFGPPIANESSVRRMSSAEESSGKRGYRDPAAGAYFPDLASIRERPAWTLTTVAFHETEPGHLLQLRRESLARPHPLQARYAPGYPEGWAIYAEALVDSAGLLSPAEQLGFIQSVLFRLARVTCDIGIHLRRWDRARAIAYLEETVGFELFFPFAVEVDRYSAEPGAFAGDSMVALTLMKMGRKAAASGGLRGFHESVLNRGPMSAEAIERVVR